MKKFFTVVSLQFDEPSPVHYRAVGNSKLQMEETVCYPILPVINGYAEPGEDFRLIAVKPDSSLVKDGSQKITDRNLDILKDQFKDLCDRRGLVCSRGVEVLPVISDQSVATHASTFRKLIDYVDNGDELFCCMTFGTKPLSQALMLAVQYAYRVKNNATISCIVYGDLDHSKRPPTDGSIYDVTALTQMDEIVHMLAECGVSDPKSALDRILSL